MKKILFMLSVLLLSTIVYLDIGIALNADTMLPIDLGSRVYAIYVLAASTGGWIFVTIKAWKFLTNPFARLL
jgi:hypothetical protein